MPATTPPSPELSPPDRHPTPATVTQAREHLIGALEAELIGPYDLPGDGSDTSNELLRLPPSRWYLAGFLAPGGAREVTEPTDDELAAGSDQDDEEGGAAEAGPRRKHRLPASMGLSVLLPPASGKEPVRATVRWADYRPEGHEIEAATGGETERRQFWRRYPQGPVSVNLDVDSWEAGQVRTVDVVAGVVLVGRVVAAEARGLGVGTRALAVFVVNQRGSKEKGPPDENFLFQVNLELQYKPGFVPRPNWRSEDSGHRDERIADLQFRRNAEWVVGHGVAAKVIDGGDAQPVQRVATTWMPRAEVPRVVPRSIDGLVIAMEHLAEIDDPGELRRGLAALPEAYTQWLDEQADLQLDSDNRRHTRDELLADARRTCARIAEGIELLASDAEVRNAFRLMNRAMAWQALKVRPSEQPHWRLFQLAFVLVCLPSIADEAHADRELVELIYFPTGGGKTEAYLGVIATTLLLRRLRGQARADAGDGVAVMLRYTLRLLTLDQLARASTLICALELLRREHPELLGTTRFAIGLWVGRSATANTLKAVTKQINDFKNSRSETAPSPFPLTQCPWCRNGIGRDSLRLEPEPQRPEEVRVHCLNDDCDFHVDSSPEGLPVLFVDEQIYRELPAFLVATVDKFAMLPWRGETGMLFGRAGWRAGRRFYGPLDSAPRDGQRLPEGLRPPELIVQDELHLISGPLGTMVGLYETAVEALCQRTLPAANGTSTALRPKVLAATATVRQAQEQIRALFGRPRPPAVFPPPGIADGETFFALVDHQSPGRLYLGLAAPGRAMKALLLRCYVTLLAAAQKIWDERGTRHGVPPETADAYMTLAGYFNSLRELGGMRRLVEDEVVTRCLSQSERRPEDTDRGRWFHDRRLAPEPLELTSREPTGRIAEAKTSLAVRHDTRHPVDVLLASSMISVGVDISRLGLMVIAGQPKTTAEYIQASSRVGRQPEVGPGLVVTCFNVHKPRDRSHYEHFTAYHQSFYRDVEASSVTPFSAPALGRGLAGVIVALTRLLRTEMTPNSAAVDIERHRELGEQAVAILAERALRHRNLTEPVAEHLSADLARLGRELLDGWTRLAQQAREGASGRRYSPWDLDRQGGPPLLFTALDDPAPPDGTDDARFEAPTSMRDVEATTHLWLQRQPLGGRQP